MCAILQIEVMGLRVRLEEIVAILVMGCVYIDL